jgi:hypothetical protein
MNVLARSQVVLCSLPPPSSVSLCRSLSFRFFASLLEEDEEEEGAE